MEVWICISLSLRIIVIKLYRVGGDGWYWNLIEKEKARLNFRGKWSYQGKALEQLEIIIAPLGWAAQVFPLG